MGVHRAMEKVLAEANKKEGPLFTFGPLIHNKQVLELLETKGIRPVADLKGLHSGGIVIRAHGIPPQKRQAIKRTGLKIIDATCPRVARVHAIIRAHSRKGYTTIIVGDKDHPEVIGLIGYSESPVHLIQDVKDVLALPQVERAFVVAQTTQDEKKFQKVVKALEERFPGILVFNTICDATHQRQNEVRSFAGQVDAVVVAGGYHSGNTQRLAQVAREEGLPTFQVETEKDLEKEKLSGMEVIGVTAGASTPNWMINNIVKEIEGIRGRRESLFFRWIKPIVQFLALSNLLVAGGAFCFAYALSILLHRKPDLIFPSVTFLYIYAMHVLNRFLDRGASAYNDPERAAFLRRHKSLLIITAVAAILTALVLCYSVGIITFLAMIGLSLLGVIYSIHLFPVSLRHKIPYSKIKDIPGSRSLSESLAWAAIITVLPLLEKYPLIWPATLVCIFIVLSISYVRSALFDIFQAQGDLIVGTETLPIILGEKKALDLLKILLLAATLLVIVSPVFGIVGPFSYCILLPLVSLSLCLKAYEKRWLYPGITFEVLVEGIFFLTGFLALIWQAMGWQL